jgi:hypothetical protein
MDSKPLKIKIDSSEAVKASDNLNKLNNTSKNTEKQNNTLVGSNKSLFDSFTKGNVAIGATITAMSILVKKGVEYSASIEKLRNGLTTLNVMTSKNIASNGQALSLEEKYNIARKESIVTMQKLNAVNLETPHTLEQTVQIYKSMYTSMRNVGVSSEEMIDLTKKLSIAAGSSGIEFQQLLSGIDGLATGTVEVSSELGRFLKSIGLSNEELKKSSNIYDTINNKLKDVKGLQGYDEAVSNLTNSFNQLTGSLVEPFFDDVKKGINGLSGLFNELTKSVTLFYDKFKSISELTTKDQLNKRAIEVSNKIAQLQEDLKNPSFFQSTGKMSAELRAANLELLSINQQFEKMNESSNKQLVSTGINRNDADIIKIMGTEYQKLNQTIEDNVNALKKAGATEKEINDYRLNAIKEFNEKQNKTKVSSVKSTNDELLKLEKEHQENIRKVTQDAKDMITSDIDKLANEYINMYSIVKDTLSPEELNKLNEAFQQRAEDITGVTDLLREAQEITTSEIDKINDKYMKMYEVVKNNPMFDDEKMRLFYEKWQQAIEDTKEKMDFSKSIKLDTEGENRAIAKISKGFDELNEASKQYQENKVKAGKDTAKLAQNEEQYRKDQVNGYSNISNAMSDMFKEGSREAAAFQAASTALALVEATRAILTQGTGDPYTAIPRMVAMAAMVGSLMKNIGVAFGMNKGSVSKDAFSAQTANTGTGTTLGDSKKASDSIKNSLEILEDFAKPQFRLASSMDASLKSIDSKIGGVTSLLVRNAGFALGEGFVGSSSSSQNVTMSSGVQAGLGLAGNATYGAGVGILTGSGALAGALAGTGVGLGVMAIDKVLLGGAISNVIGGAVNSVLGGLFGKTSVKSTLTDSGITFANALLKNAIEDFEGSAYQEIKTKTTKKSWFSSSSKTKYKTYFQGLDDELENQFSLVLKNLYDTVYESGMALDVSSKDLTKRLNSFVVSIGKISLKDKTGDQIQELLSNVFGKVGDDLTKSVFPLLTSFQQVGEGVFETLTRVATGMEQADFYISRLGGTFKELSYLQILNKQGNVGFEALYQSLSNVEKQLYPTNNGLLEIVDNLDATAEELYNVYISLDELRDRLIFLGQDAAGLSSTMLYGAGGIEVLADGFNSFFENFLSESEQLTYKTTQMIDEFNKLGVALPISKDGFKDLLSSLDLTTDSGKELYGRLITLSKAFAEVSEGVEESIKALEDSLKSSFDSFADNFDGLFTNIQNNILETQNLIDKLRGKNTSGPQDTLFNNLVKYNKALDEYAETGSQESYKNILDLSSVIGDNNSKLTSTLADNLEGFLDDFNSDQNTIRVNIVDGLGGLLGLNEEQVTQLKAAASDGKITNEELNSIKGLTQTQKDGVLDFAKNSSLFSTEETLNSLNEYMKKQLEVLQKTQAEETANLSKQTLTYGDYVGKQEQIDIAKLLGVSYESAKPLIEQVQALSVSKNPTADLQKILGYTGKGDLDYDTTTASMLQKLAPYLGSVNVGSTLKGIQGNIKVDEAEIAKQKAIEEAARKKAEAIALAEAKLQAQLKASQDKLAWALGHFSTSSAKNRARDLNALIQQGNYQGAINLSNPDASGRSWEAGFDKIAQAAITAQANLVKVRGYAVGAVNIPHDQLAQIHQKEMIIPATFAEGLREGKLSLSSIADAPKITATQLYKGISSAFDNSVIVNELRAMREQLSYLNGLNTTQTATQLKTLSATRALIS